MLEYVFIYASNITIRQYEISDIMISLLVITNYLFYKYRYSIMFKYILFNLVLSRNEINDHFMTKQYIFFPKQIILK